MPNDSSDPRADEPTFVDTNVLVYAHDASEAAKQAIARAALERLWSTRTGVLSTQVLQEFYVVATSPHKLALSPSEAREIVDLYSAWPVVVLDPVLILAASRLHETSKDLVLGCAHRRGGAGRRCPPDPLGGLGTSTAVRGNPGRGPVPTSRRFDSPSIAVLP